MQNNVIILAVGLSGSSVLTGLVSRAGYSLGESTVEKPDYNTFENAELVRLNQQLLEMTHATRFGLEYRGEFIEKMRALPGRIDEAPFRAFIKRCDARQRWVWKDPRLTVTIHFWKHLLDLQRIKFIVNDRELLQAWISWNIRREIQSYAYAKRYTQQVVGAIHAFLNENGLRHVHVRYEDLICEPEPTLARINAFIGSSLTLDDLSRVYRGPLRKKTHGLVNFAKAGLIYLKNYEERFG
jgi:hypothetical protein